MTENNQQLGNYNLLVIDDEEEITKSIFRQFRRKYNVHVATSALKAFPILEKENIQVVLSDQRMPELTGVDFFSQIKDKYPDAIKLILTGYSDIEAVIGAINEGQVFRYITKPWNPIELSLAIDEAFEKYELITKNKKLLNKLKEANATLEKKVEERTQELKAANINLTNINIEKNKYIGIVAHDLRNPIGIAQQYSELLISNLSKYTEEKQLKFLEIIHGRCAFSLNLMEDLLDTSKIEAGILNLNFREVNYCQFVQKNIEQNSLFAHEKAQEIFFSCECPDTLINIDKEKMEQVLNNLISNAIKFSETNTKIWVNIKLSNNMIVTQIKDEGQGIPEDELGSIFSAYQTTSVKSTNHEKSTGLGLTIVKKIIDAHNGIISVESKPGIGSEFKFFLPFK